MSIVQAALAIKLESSWAQPATESKEPAPKPAKGKAAFSSRGEAQQASVLGIDEEQDPVVKQLLQEVRRNCIAAVV